MNFTVVALLLSYVDKGSYSVDVQLSLKSINRLES